MKVPKIWPGQPYPLGAMHDGAGCNFAVFSEHAERVELCFFDEEDREHRLDLPEVTAFCWHGYVPDLAPGTRYGFRVHGPWRPEEGLLCTPSKLLLDPYARAIDGDVKWNEAIFPYHFGDPDGPLNTDDSAPYVPKSVVTSPWFDWADDRHPNIPWHESIIYELHVKGFTKLMERVPEDVRGTYSGLAHPAAIGWLKELGVTAVELMPVHHFIHDHALVERKLSNYWGYTTIGFFAPHAGYASSSSRGGQVQEFKQMVKALHHAGIEVILDVVYNHSAEGNHLGPVLSWKGYDNPAYYKLVGDNQRYYMDYTGTGNTFNVRSPQVLQLIMDSLRYWATEMHVDGFRFDLAAALARELPEVDRLSAFFDVIHQDPVVRHMKLIAEPWDVGENGYHVGNFPPLWTEWNGKFRDCVRDYWRGEPQTLGELAHRLTGSSDLYQSNGRRPYASINFITAHDGFTLNDVVSYNEKHNDANGNNNTDGESHNRTWNCGAEGPTDDSDINALRSQQQRNFLATLFLSQGVPMLVAGDDIGHKQGGNNNTYCQDNELSWLHWAETDQELAAFTRGLIALRKAHPVLRRRRWFHGRPLHGGNVADIAWFKPDGAGMTDEDWQAGFARSVALFLSGDGVATPDTQGEKIMDQSFFLIFNAHDGVLPFVLPARDGSFALVLDTARAAPPKDDDAGYEVLPMGATVEVAARSVRVYRHVS